MGSKRAHRRGWRNRLSAICCCEAIVQRGGPLPASIVQIGVGRGWETPILSRYFPPTRVDYYGFEPLKLNRKRQVAPFPGTLLPHAVTAVDGGEATLSVNRERSSVHFDEDAGLDTVGVETVTLDYFRDSVRPPEPILLWLDCEGGERDVIFGGERSLRSGAVKYVWIETVDAGPPGWTPFNEIRELLAAADFHFVYGCGKFLPPKNGGDRLFVKAEKS